MSLGRPDRGSVDNPDRLFQILTGLYDALNGVRTSVTILEQRIVTVTDNSVAINVSTGGDRVVSPLEVGGDNDTDSIGGPPPGGGSGSSSMARVWVSTPDPMFPNGVNLGALTTGVLQHTVTAGVSVPSAFALGAGLIPYGNGSSLIATIDGLAFDDGGDGSLSLNDDVGLAHYNLGDRSSSTNYERVMAKWVTNVWLLQSQEAGTGVVRPMTIDADTATLTLDGGAVAVDTDLYVLTGSDLIHRNLGAVGAGTYEQVRAFWSSNEWFLATEMAGGTERNMVIGNATNATVKLTSATGAYLVGGTGGAAAPLVAASSLNIVLTAPVERARSAGATLDAINMTATTVQISGAAGTNITTALGFNYFTIAAPTLTGLGNATTISTASTMVIQGPPTGINSATITTAMTFWVQAGRTRIDGHFTGAGSGSNLGFFGFNGAAQVTAGAATAGALYTATEQAMLQTVYDMARTYNLMT